MDLKISELTREIALNEEALKKSESELKAINSSMTTEEAVKQLAAVRSTSSKSYSLFLINLFLMILIFLSYLPLVKCSNAGLGRK